MGNEPFGGGNNNLLIHVGQADAYVNSGILEETLVHEAAHTFSMGHMHMRRNGSHEEKDGDSFNYARDTRFERHCRELSSLFCRPPSLRPYFADLKQIIEMTIPHRIQYFDSQNFDFFSGVGDLWVRQQI